MKFDCGLSSYDQNKENMKWHRWFAWHPVRVGRNDCRWLEYVERRGDYTYVEVSWEYRV